MLALLCLVATVFGIGMIAMPGGVGDRIGLTAVAGCLGTALWLVIFSCLAQRMAMGSALPLALLGALALALVSRFIDRHGGVDRCGGVAWGDSRGEGKSPPDTRGPGPTLQLVILSLVGIAAVRGYFYDELDHHLPLTMEILSGYYPPPYPFLPQAPFRYYFGFDLLAAAITQVSGLAPWYAFDALTLLAAFALVRLVWSLGATAPAAAAPEMSVWLGVMGGGLAWVRWPMDVWALPNFDVGVALALPFVRLEYQPWQLPPPAGYLFQHPMALGLPLFFALLRLWVDARLGAALAVATGALLGGLAAAQLILFGFAVPALACSVMLRVMAARADPAGSSGATVAGLLGVAAAGLSLGLVAAWLCTASPLPVGSGTVGSFAAGAGDLGLRWPPGAGWGPDWPFPGYLSAFGVPALLGVAGAVIAVRRRWLAGTVLALVAVGGFVAPHIVEIRQSPWNTTKLFIPAMIAWGILGGVALANATSAAAPRLRRRLRVAILACASASPLLFLTVRCLGPLDIDPAAGALPVQLLPNPAGGADRLAGLWLSTRATRGEVALTANRFVTAFSGVPSLAPQPQVSAWSRQLDPEGYHDRAIQVLWATLDPSLLSQYSIRWLVMGPRERQLLGAQATRSLADPGLFTLATTLLPGPEERQIWRVLAGSTSTPRPGRSSWSVTP